MPRDDGRLHIMYNEMGQGDNIWIKCPNGKVLMIDCGTSRYDRNWFEERPAVVDLRALAVRNVFETGFLKDNQTLNVMILTHGDRDHCNEVASILDHDLVAEPPIPKIAAIEELYHSGTLAISYVNTGAHGYLTTTRPPTHTYAITVNQNEKKIGVDGADARDIPNSAAGTAEIRKKSMQDATSGFVKILDGTQGALSCNVYILASNVTKYPGLEDGYGGSAADDIQNRSSVVTMVIYGDKKFLFLGDATYNTEKFLKDTYGDKIQDLEMVHAGHHASYRTSSSYGSDVKQKPNVKAIDFVSHVNPKYLAVSAAYDSGTPPSLPRWEVIQNYINGATRLAVKNGERIHCWWDQAEGVSGNKRKSTDPVVTQPDYKTTDRNIQCTGTHGVLDYKYKEEAGTARAYETDSDGNDHFLP